MIVPDTQIYWKCLLADCLSSYCMLHEQFNKRLRNLKNEKLLSPCLVLLSPRALCYIVDNNVHI